MEESVESSVAVTLLSHKTGDGENEVLTGVDSLLVNL
jgi:hypothetical protein